MLLTRAVETEALHPKADIDIFCTLGRPKDSMKKLRLESFVAGGLWAPPPPLPKALLLRIVSSLDGTSIPQNPKPHFLNLPDFLEKSFSMELLSPPLDAAASDEGTPSILAEDRATRRERLRLRLAQKI